MCLSVTSKTFRAGGPQHRERAQTLNLRHGTKSCSLWAARRAGNQLASHWNWDNQEGCMLRQIIKVHNKFSNSSSAYALMLNIEIHFWRENYIMSHEGRILKMIFTRTLLIFCLQYCLQSNFWCLKILHVCCQSNTSTGEPAEQWS